MDELTEKCANEFPDEKNVTYNPWPFIACVYGLQRQEMSMTLLITVINGLIFITGVLGNIAVCIVIIKHPTLHTATNYYLFNLAVSDITLLIFGLPNDVALYWHQYPYPFGETFCKFRALVSESASYVSVLTVVAFSTERYIAICYPLYLRAISGLQRAIWIIGALWAVALLCALPFAIYTELNYLYYPINSTEKVMDSVMCIMEPQPRNFPITELSTMIFFILPMFIIAFLYVNMGIAIAKASKTKLEGRMKGSIHRKNKKNQSNKNIIRMLLFVVLGFFLCWAPFHLQRLMTIYFTGNEVVENVNTWMFFITGICYYFSSTLNPVLYNVMSEKMRNAFKEIFCGVKRKKTLKRGTFRETSNTFVSMYSGQNNHHHHQSLNNDEDLFITKDTNSILLNTDDYRNGKKIIHNNSNSIRINKLRNETGV